MVNSVFEGLAYIVDQEQVADLPRYNYIPQAVVKWIVFHSRVNVHTQTNMFEGWMDAKVAAT